MTKNSNEDSGTAPFNMALFTLEKIHNILKLIIMVSSGYDENENPISSGKAQHLKYSLIRQLYVQSIPLLDPVKNKEWKKEMWEKIKNINLKWKQIIDTSRSKIVGYSELATKDNEILFDEIIIEIQERLQEEKYFMPPKDDPKYSWKQD